MHRVVLALALALAVSGASAEQCDTLDEKVNVLEANILEHYGERAWSDLEIYPIQPDVGQFQTFFYPAGRSCEGTVTIDRECRLGDEHGKALSGGASFEDLIRCKLYDTD